MRDDRKFLILADGAFGSPSAKTAEGCLRYLPTQVVGVVDARHAGRTAQDVVGFGGAVPVVATFADGLALEPTALLVGTAPVGGQLSEEWRTVVRGALTHGLDVWSGLHVFLGSDPEFVALARTRGGTIHDLRKPPTDLRVSSGRVRDVEATVVLTVGADCNIGKMTAQLQLRDALQRRGTRVAFVATGQTGILIAGRGIAVDAVIADFIGGAAEQLVLEAARDADLLLVEGQGSIIHPGYSGVTYGLMHGSLPHAMVLCAQPSRTTVRHNPWLPIPPLTELIRLHEAVLAPLRPSQVIAVALNTSDLSEPAALAAIARVAGETGLPTTDPVRFDPSPVASAIVAFHERRMREERATGA